MDDEHKMQPEEIPAELELETENQKLLYKIFIDNEISRPELQMCVRKLIINTSKLPQFGLKEDDFSVYCMFSENMAWKISGGVKPTLIFSTHPRHKDFKRALYEGLTSIARVKQGKSIDLRHRLQPGESLVKLYEDKLEAEGLLTPRGDLELEFYTVIRAKHKITGVVITEEYPSVKYVPWYKMQEAIRRKMATLVKVVGYVKEARFNKPLHKGLHKLNKLGD